MSKEDMNQFECYYCHSKGICEHLVAAYDEIGHEIIVGLLRNSNELKEMVQLVFEQLYHIYKERVVELFSDSLSDLWYDSYDGDDGSVHVNNIDSYIVEKLSELLVSEVEDFDSGPGSATTYELFYHNHPANIKIKLVRLVEMDLKKAKDQANYWG